jgi:hypothetical protein
MVSLRYLAFVCVYAAIPALAQVQLADALPLGAACGANGACDKGLWCEPAAGACTSQVGVCVSVPSLCFARKRSKNYKPVCGCNGKTYSSDCFRRGRRIVKLHDGKC